MTAAAEQAAAVSIQTKGVSSPMASTVPGTA